MDFKGEPTDLGSLEEELNTGIDNVAVEGLVFDTEFNWILMERGPSSRDEVGKLEGIGGSVEEGDEGFREALIREIEEEAGDDALIEIVDFLESRRDVPDSGEEWIILSYICVLKSGEPRVMEPGKNRGFKRVRPDEVDAEKLSSSTRKARKSLKKNWEKVKQLIEASL